MQRKGFPESYDVRRLVRFMADVKSGVAEVLGAGLLASAPTTSCPASSRWCASPTS